MALTIVLRLVHVLSGVVWVGFALFAAFYLMPALAEAGPDGGKVMLALDRRNLLTTIPVVALLTVLSGIWLYLRAAHLAPGFGASRMGITLGIGGAVAIVALLIGVSVISPSMNRAVAAVKQASQATADEERQALLSQATNLRVRAAGAARLASLLLIVAAAAMAIGRYV